MVGLGEVDELEVEAEGAGELVGGGEVVGVVWTRPRACCEMACGRGCVAGGVGLAAGDGGAAELFDGGVEGVAGLFAEDLAEQHAEGADVAAERSFFELAGGGLEFGEALRPVRRSPERRHSMIMPCFRR